MKKSTLISIALIVILGFLVYANSLNGKFIWDDTNLVENNMYIKDWSNTAKIFRENILVGSGIEYNFYRPIQILSFMFDYSLWKMNPLGYHLTNILLHILATLAIFWLIKILYDDWHYDDKETCFLLKGKVTVTTKDGKAVNFGAGDLVAFPEGLSCVWDIQEAVKKHYKFG